MRAIALALSISWGAVGCANCADEPNAPPAAAPPVEAGAPAPAAEGSGLRKFPPMPRRRILGDHMRFVDGALRHDREPTGN